MRVVTRVGCTLRSNLRNNTSALRVAFRPSTAPHTKHFVSFSSASARVNGSAVGGLCVGTGLVAASLGVAWGCMANPTHAESSVDDAQTPVQKATAGLRSFFSPIIDTYSEINEVLCGDQSILLPMEVPDPYGRPVRTVCINLEKTMIYPMWTRDYGWVVRKRPYVDLFLERLARAGYEVVLFSDSNQFDSEQNVMDLDRMGILRHKLYKDATNFKQGRYVKDLSRLGRDLTRVVLVDHNYEDSALLQPDNAIHVSPFTDDLSDKELYRVLVLLENMVKHNVHDVREVVKKYNAEPNKNHFEKEEKLALEYRQQLAEEEGISVPKKSGGGSWLGSWSGVLRKSK